MIQWLHLIHVFALVHSLYLYGKRWTFLFFVIGFSLGLLSEHLGATCGWVFGKFHYQPDRLMFFGTVPIFTPVSWWLILYCAYNTTNLIFGDVRRLRAKGFGIPLAVFLLSLLDGLMAMNLDLIFDPTMTCPERGRWVWEFGGSYFNIPVQNFIGWFAVGFFISLPIRIYDLWSKRLVPLGERFVHYLPTAVYFAMFVLFALLNVVGGHPQYVLIGFGTMMPFVLWVAVRAVFSLGAGRIVEEVKD